MKVNKEAKTLKPGQYLFCDSTLMFFLLSWIKQLVAVWAPVESAASARLTVGTNGLCDGPNASRDQSKVEALSFPLAAR